MRVPIDKVIGFDGNKYEATAAMTKYIERIEEEPEILLDYSEKDKEKIVAIVIDEILSGKLKYHYKESDKK
jgi:DNA-directed RNA polymerase subunit K/omega